MHLNLGGGCQQQGEVCRAVKTSNSTTSRLCGRKQISPTAQLPPRWKQVSKGKCDGRLDGKSAPPSQTRIVTEPWLPARRRYSRPRKMEEASQQVAAGIRRGHDDCQPSSCGKPWALFRVIHVSRDTHDQEVCRVRDARNMRVATKWWTFLACVRGLMHRTDLREREREREKTTSRMTDKPRPLWPGVLRG
ncbi:hypothetical protein LX36DRAFT_72666 [Colletotrichum falcatum]|nr:hypothetical protein LX36DRAFT_72666 [Colletotrichum falcatum]